MGNTKVRESNIELLRNISMFMILIIHANFVSLPWIEYEELTTDMVPSATRFFIESLGIVAVNVFVFISGWFGINTRKKSVLSFIYMILWFYGGGYLLFLLLGKVSFSLTGVMDVLQLTRKDWFIKAYLVLMIVAPILNTFSRTAEEKTQRYVTIAFLMFEAIFGWATGARRFFIDGYGPLHFIGLYITAQYIHNQLGTSSTPAIIKRLFLLPKALDISIFLFTAIINTAMIIIGSLYLCNVPPIHRLFFAYSNPLVVVGSIYLFLFFSKLKMKNNKVINWLGASSFAVYLFHSETSIRSLFFTPNVQWIYNNINGVKCLMIMFLFLCFIYLISVLIDQLRILTWNKIWGNK